MKFKNQSDFGFLTQNSAINNQRYQSDDSKEENKNSRSYIMQDMSG